MQRNNTNSEYDLIIFFALTILLSFAATRLPLMPDLVQVVMVCIPTVVAVVIIMAIHGRSGVSELFLRSFSLKRPIRWYLIAIGLALILRLLVSLIALLLGWVSTIQVRPWSPVMMAAFAVAVFLFALLEEIGWRGFALQRLLSRRSTLFSALFIGVLWSIVHTALTLPGMAMQTIAPWIVFGQIIGLSLVITWLFLASQGSVIVAALFHAAQTFFVILNEGISLEQNALLLAVVLLAAGLVVMAGHAINRHHRLKVRPEIPAA